VFNGRTQSGGCFRPAELAWHAPARLFPVSTDKGITGELVWPRVPEAILSRGEAPARSRPVEAPGLIVLDPSSARPAPAMPAR
jgi:hypothetical protein